MDDPGRPAPASPRVPLRVLLVEDSPDDALLVAIELRRGGYEVQSRRVQTEPELKRALAEQPWDLVVSDFALPGFDALGALRAVQEAGLDLPFLVVSGTLGEEMAVEVLKAGAHDFVLKDRLARFLPAVVRELREASIRQERRRAEAALRESELTHRRIVETAQEGIWQLDASGRTTFANRRMAAMLGTTPEQLMGRPASDFVPGGLPRAATEIELRRTDGTTFWGSISVAPISGNDGTPTGMLAMVADVSERRKMQTQLMVSDRMASVGMLAAGVAHEINNPLSAVLGNLDLAAKAAVGDPLLRDLLRDAFEAAERVRWIVQDLKLFSRAEEDSRSPIDVRQAVRSALRMAQTAVRHRAQLVADLKPVPPVLASESRLGQVVLNLVVNAAQAIPEGRASENRIVVATRLMPSEDEDSVVIEVRDTGVGMTPEIVANLFTPFFTTKNHGVGTGLGLSICQRIVASIGGRITVESVPGAGSTFRVLLPTTRSEPYVASPAPPQKSQPRHRARVLVIDDEPMIGTLLRRILRDHEVVVTTSAAEAQLQLQSHVAFDVILCDLMMPEKTGMDLYEEVVVSAPEKAARFVFVTGGAFTPRARAFLDQVPNPRVDKPFDPKVIQAMVASMRG